MLLGMRRTGLRRRDCVLCVVEVIMGERVCTILPACMAQSGARWHRVDQSMAVQAYYELTLVEHHIGITIHASAGHSEPYIVIREASLFVL